VRVVVTPVAGSRSWRVCRLGGAKQATVLESPQIAPPEESTEARAWVDRKELARHLKRPGARLRERTKLVAQAHQSESGRARTGDPLRISHDGHGLQAEECGNDRSD
jgi:hypothetical protein